MMSEIAPASEAAPAGCHGRQSHVICPICRAADVEDFFHLPRLPIHVGMTYDSAEQARRAPVGRVTLSYCHSCGHVFNRAFEPDELVFEPGYEVQLVHSSVFNNFLRDTAQRLIQRYHLHGKDLIDIGCGAGHFLRLLCEGGENRGLGIDPTVCHEGSVDLSRGEMQLVRGLFGEHHTTAMEFDFATCQSVLEDVADPVAILRGVRRSLAARQGHAYLEVFNALRAFEAGEVWSLTYEQCQYYSLNSFSEAIRRAGFQIVDSGTCYGDGQYLYVDATPAQSPVLAAEPEASMSTISRFAQLHAQRLDLWQSRIAAFRTRRSKVAVWGTGGKGVCFLSTVGAEDVFAWAVDINPDRQNRYVPGSGQLIVSPAQLRTLRPDVVVITNPLYESEIRNAAAELDLSCDFLTI